MRHGADVAPGSENKRGVIRNKAHSNVQEVIGCSDKTLLFHEVQVCFQHILIQT